MTPPITLVGAGPVGLLLACLLGQRGLDVRLYEKRRGLPAASMAIGITPPSLDILDRLDLKSEFLRRGVRISRVHVHEDRKYCGTLDFRAAENEILSLPQYGTLELLRRRLADFPNVDFREGVARHPEQTADTPGRIIACDGAKSPLRQWLGIPAARKTYPVTFVMADFPDPEDPAPEGRLFFSPRGAVESFPLPNRRRRWIAQCADGAPAELETLLRRVRDAAGVDLHADAPGSVYPFTPRRLLCKSYHAGNVILCGDAAHTMSPIGGQGMNTGFADAWHLSRILPDPSPADLAAYTRARRRAFRTASRRAAAGMWLGTRTGSAAARLRRQLLSAALRQPAAHRTLALTFAMRNLPDPEFP